jgi:hypothetical protein
MQAPAPGETPGRRQVFWGRSSVSRHRLVDGCALLACAAAIRLAALMAKTYEPRLLRLMKTLCTLFITLALCVACHAQAAAEDLKKYIATLHAAIAAEKTEEAAKMTSALLPDNTRLKKALSDSVPADIVAKISELYTNLPKEPAKLAKALAPKPGQTEIQVHAATTEEIAKYADGSVAAKEFPNATKDLAVKGILRPGVTFFEVEFLEPGKDTGKKHDLFYYDGTSWTMLGPIWRLLNPPPQKK